MISLRDVVTGFGNRDPLAEVWRRSLRGGGGGSTVITGVPPLRYIGDGRPLTDYLISGNAVQDGTPSADAPVDAQGSGVRTGNLFDKNNTTIYNLFPGTENTMRVSSNVRSIAIPCVGGETYTVSKKVGKRFMVCFTTEPIDAQVTYTNLTTNNTAESITVTAPLDAKYLFVYFYNSTADVDAVETLINSIMINTGSTALPYEPYGFKLPLTVNGTEYPIYLGQVETTRRIKKLVLTGEESWSANTTAALPNIIMYMPAPNVLANTIPICTHYIGSNTSTWASLGVDKITVSILSGGVYRLAINAGTATLDDFKSYLAAQYQNGTPVTVWYVLAEPETAVVNEPLMKIGDYADTVSAAQAQVAIPTVSGENVLDVPTTVPPSQITIKGGISSV